MAGGMHEDLAIVGTGTIDPDANAIDMSKFEEVTFYVLSGGTYTDIIGRAITMPVKATDDDKQAIASRANYSPASGAQIVG